MDWADKKNKRYEAIGAKKCEMKCKVREKRKEYVVGMNGSMNVRCMAEHTFSAKQGSNTHLLTYLLIFPRNCSRMRPARYFSIGHGPGPPVSPPKR